MMEKRGSRRWKATWPTCFYPKDRKYVGLFTVRGAEDARTAKRRAEARKLALAAAAAAAGASSSSSS